MRNWAIDFSVDELVLTGFPPHQRFAISAAMMRELHRLFSARGVPAGLVERSDTPSLGAIDCVLPSNAVPDTIGVQVAQAVYGGLRQ